MDMRESEEYTEFLNDNLDDLREAFCEFNDDFDEYVDQEFRVYKDIEESE